MGTLVELPINRSAPRFAATRQAEPGESAAILFFTGVRYMRMEDAVPPAPTRSPRRARKMPAPIPAERQA